MKFKDIQFGKIAAETEMSECPDLLIKGFIDDDNIISKIVNGSLFLIYGLKGSGKSAIAAKIDLESKNNKQFITRFCYLDDLDYNMFKQFDSKKGSEIERFDKNWSTILLIAILDLMERNKEHVSFSKSAEASIEFLKKTNVLPSDRISSIVQKASKKRMWNLKLFKSSSEETEQLPTYDDLNEQFKSSVLSSKSHIKQILMIDGLDGVATFRESQYAILTSLLQMTYYLNRLLSENNVNVKIVLFCRTDFLDKMNGSNTQKIIDSHGFELLWFQEGVETKDVNLIRLLNLRAEIQTGEKTDIFDKYVFPPSIGGKEIRKFILDHTRHIPRDIVKLISNIQTQCTSEYISTKTIETAVRKYSTEYFYGEVRDELCGFIKLEMIDEMFKLFREICSYETSIIELRKEANNNGMKINLEEVLTILFDIGAIGNFKIVGAGSKTHKRYYFKYRERYASFNPNDGIIIHLALQHALKMKGMSNNSIIDIVYDE